MPQIAFCRQNKKLCLVVFDNEELKICVAEKIMAFCVFWSEYVLYKSAKVTKYAMLHFSPIDISSLLS